MLYNTFWLYVLPFCFLITLILRRIRFKKSWTEILSFVGLGLLISVVHIFLFALIFTFVSSLIYSPSHRFQHMLSTAFSNQFYIALILYSAFPFYLKSKARMSAKPKAFEKDLKVKQGSEIRSISVSAILCISTEKPYTMLHLSNEKVVDDRSLKDFEKRLDPERFIRVHRSIIVNKDAIKRLSSRKNGDYDVVLENDEAIRFSRHYRKNWQALLH